MVLKLKISNSKIKGKKYTAKFYGGKNHKDLVKTTHFGAKGMSDYTIHKDKERRERYRKRHKKDLKTKDPKRAGYLSYYILWGNSSNIKTAIKDYKKKFMYI